MVDKIKPPGIENDSFAIGQANSILAKGQSKQGKLYFAKIFSASGYFKILARVVSSVIFAIVSTNYEFFTNIRKRFRNFVFFRIS